MNRPRGLCWNCYYAPGVRDLYPSTSKYAVHRPSRGSVAEPTLAELEAMIAERRMTMPADHGDPDAAPPPEADPDPERWWGNLRSPGGSRRGADATGQWGQWAELGNARGGYVLTPETEPAAIAADQRAAVREALAALGPGAAVEAVSDLVVLPPDVVARRLAEINEGLS